MSRYTGITIGPLYNTISMAKKTGEMWAASYIFSYIMREIIQLLKEQNAVFLIPDVDDERLFTAKNNLSDEEKIKYTGAGFFHDRMIFKSNNLTIENIQDSVINDVLDKLSDNISEKINNNKTELYSYLRDYFQIYVCQKKFDEQSPAEINKEINRILDTLELQKKFIPKDKQNKQKGQVYQSLFADLLQGAKKSFLVDDAYGEKAFPNITPFESLLQISAKELENDTYKEMYKNGTDEKKIKDVLREDKNYRKFHEYAALVQADGDSIGKTIQALGNSPEGFKNFSKTLLDFSLSANEIIKTYGGLPIFIGGDDLLFFAPVKNGDDTVFTMINDLHVCFEDKFKGFSEPPTLSFGVSIGHYKYPLAESLNSARGLLFDKAKNLKGKNSIAYRMLIHSGQSYDGIIYKGNNDLYDLFNQFMNVGGKEKIFTSVMFEITQQKAVIREIADHKDALKNFFANNFNESVHNSNEDYFEKIIELIYLIFKDDSYNTTDNEKIRTIESVLKLHKFIMGEK